MNWKKDKKKILWSAIQKAFQNNLRQDSPIYEMIRQNLVDINSSEISNVLGIGYKSRIQYWRESKKIQPTKPPSEYLKLIMNRGKEVEVAVKLLLTSEDKENYPVNSVSTWNINPGYWIKEFRVVPPNRRLWLGVSPDTIYNHEPLEIKYSSKGKAYEYPKLLHIPQVLSQMFVTNSKSAIYVNVWENMDEHGLQCWKIYWSDEAWNYICDKLEEWFVTYLPSDSPPPRLSRYEKGELVKKLSTCKIENYDRFSFTRKGPLPFVSTVHPTISNLFVDESTQDALDDFVQFVDGTRGFTGATVRTFTVGI